MEAVIHLCYYIYTSLWATKDHINTCFSTYALSTDYLLRNID